MDFLAENGVALGLVIIMMGIFLFAITANLDRNSKIYPILTASAIISGYVLIVVSVLIPQKYEIKAISTLENSNIISVYYNEDDGMSTISMDEYKVEYSNNNPVLEINSDGNYILKISKNVYEEILEEQVKNSSKTWNFVKTNTYKQDDLSEVSITEEAEKNTVTLEGNGKIITTNCREIIIPSTGNEEGKRLEAEKYTIISDDDEEIFKLVSVDNSETNYSLKVNKSVQYGSTIILIPIENGKWTEEIIDDALWRVYE